VTTPLFGCEVPAVVKTAGPRPLRVLGLDLSLTATGVCLTDGTTFTIKTRQKDGDRRLLHIADVITSMLADGSTVDLAVLEDIPQNSHAAKPIAMVHGVVRTALNRVDVPYVTVAPATLKAFATGSGKGDKTPMVMAAYKRAGREFGDDNQCDAAWLRWAALDHYGQPEFDLPKVQRDRLAKVTWPDLAAVAQ
jgi:Holliday junction resolvasome RuvABC endonuclease subunit